MFNFAPERRRRRPDLTPMIDVVFLLLVFFMLASRFTNEVSMPLVAATGQGGEWHGAPRLVDVGTDGKILLNGVEVSPDALIAQLKDLTKTPDDPVILRAKKADLQALVHVMDILGGAGFSHLILVE